MPGRTARPTITCSLAGQLNQKYTLHVMNHIYSMLSTIHGALKQTDKDETVKLFYDPLNTLDIMSTDEENGRQCLVPIHFQSELGSFFLKEPREQEQDVQTAQEGKRHPRSQNLVVYVA